MEASRLEKEHIAIKRTVHTIEQEHPNFFPRHNAVVAGSAAMVLAGIDRHKQIGDIDIFVTSELWIELLQSGQWSVYVPGSQDKKRRHDPPFLYKKFAWDVEETDTIEVAIFFAWRHREKANITVKDMFDHATDRHGILSTGMDWLLNWKREAVRDKDLPDIELIEEQIELEG